jgi:antitoxin VapB
MNMHVYTRVLIGIRMKNPKTEKRTPKLATDRAADHRLDKLGPERRKKGRVNRKKLAELLAYFNSLPKTNEHLTDEQVIGYDEQGLP